MISSYGTGNYFKFMKRYGGFRKYLQTNNFSGKCNETIDREIAMDTTAN